MSYVIKAILSNPRRPGCGQITIPFPIAVDQYSQTIEMLRAMGLGDITDQDCTVDNPDSHYGVLGTLEGMAQFLGLITDERRQELYHEMDEFIPKCVVIATDGLPNICYSTLPDTGALICIRLGEHGYQHSDLDTGDPIRNEEAADRENQRLGVTEAQRLAMEAGCAHGWDCPAADPKVYEQTQQQTGGMM